MKKCTFSKLEFCFLVVKERNVWSVGSDEGWAFEIGSHLDCFFCRIAVTGNKDYTVGNSPEKCEIFQCHLTGTVFSDAASSMRSNHFHITVADSYVILKRESTCDSDLVSSSREEGSKGRTKRNFLSATETSGHSNHVLFSNEALNIAFFEAVLESDRES